MTIGQTDDARLEMGVSGVAETISVSGATPIIETSRSQVSSTVDEIAVQRLPVNGRNFIDFALLTPGVTRDTRTGDISFAGQRGTLNSLVVDGADNNNTFFGQSAGRTGSGRAPYQFSQDAVKEFQVNSNSFSAEYGRAGGAVINVVTKSGTNELHGSAFEFYRDKALNANNAINELNDRPKSPYHYNQFGGTVGGPIRKNRDFYFANYDGQRNTQPNVVFLNLPATTPSDRGDPGGHCAAAAAGQQLGAPLNQDVVLVKTDHELNAANRITLRYNHQNFTGEGFEAGGPQNALEHTGASLVKTRTFNAAWTSVLSPTLFNEVRVQLSRDREPGEANSTNPEAVVQQSGATVLTIGRNNFSPRETTIKRWQIADTLTLVRGTHKLKGGFDFQFDDILNDFPGFFSGSYTFRSLASFAGGRPNGATSPISRTSPARTRPARHPPEPPRVSRSSRRTSGGRHATSRSMLGLRYDLMKTAAPPVRNPDPQLAAADIDTSRLDADTNNFGPRLGLAWSPHGRPLRAARRLGPLLRPHAVDHAWHRALQQRRQHRLADVHRRRVPTYPQKFDAIPAAATAGTAEHLLHRQGFRERAADAGQRRGRMADAGADDRYRDLPVRGWRRAIAVDRSQRRHAGARTYTLAGYRHHLLVSALRRRPPVRQLPAGDCVRVDARCRATTASPWSSTAVSPATRSSAPRTRSARWSTPCRTPPPSSRAIQATTSNTPRTRPTSAPIRPSATTTSVIVSWPAASTAPTRWRTASRGGPHAWYRLVVQRHLHRAVRPTLHGAGRRGRSEQRRQQPQRHRTRNDAQPVPVAICGHVRSEHRAGSATRTHPCAADLGSLQPVQSRQHYRGRSHVLQCVGHDSDARHDVRASQRERR